MGRALPTEMGAVLLMEAWVTELQRGTRALALLTTQVLVTMPSLLDHAHRLGAVRMLAAVLQLGVVLPAKTNVTTMTRLPLVETTLLLHPMHMVLLPLALLLPPRVLGQIMLQLLAEPSLRRPLVEIPGEAMTLRRLPLTMHQRRQWEARPPPLVQAMAMMMVVHDMMRAHQVRDLITTVVTDLITP